MKSPALRRPIFWFAPAAVLFAAVALISMSSTRALIETDDRVSNTYEVIGRIESLRAGLANTESSRQAYLLTGDPAHLKPYLASSGHLDEDFAQLRRLTSDNVEQQRRLDQLGPLLSGERGALKESIDAGPSTDLAVRVSAMAQSARTREQVDALLTEMHVEENRLLQVRTEEARESAQNTVVVVAGAIILTMVLVCIAALIARRDSLERKRSEEALHESQARLAGIIDSAMDAIITLDADQRVILFNAAAERTFGYSAAQVIGQSISILLPERFRASLQGLLSAFGEPGSAGGSTGAAGARLALRSDGSEFPIEASVSTVQVAGTKLFTVILRDATERERADAERRRLTRAVEQSPASIVITDPKGVIEYVNPKFCQITGYSSEEVIGQNPRVLKSGEISPEGYRRLWETISSGGEWRGEFHNKKKNGELYWELASISPVLNSAGTIKHYVAVKEDITERKRAEVELAEQYEAADHARSETRAVLDSAGEAIILIGPDRRFRMVNRRFGEVFGIPAEDIVGHYFDEFEEYARRVFADLEEVRAYIVRAAYDTWEPFTETVAQSWPVAREHELYSTAVRGTDGDYLGRLYVFRDVTHEREVDRMKTEFVSLVSHELRTPLTSIKGFTDLILDGVAGPVTDQQGEYLGIVKQNSDRLVALVNDILDISRIESGRMQLNKEPVSLREIIDLVALSLGPQIQNKAQTLTVQIDPELPQVLGDVDRLTQVVTNLLSNASKYTQVGGTIRIEAKQDQDWVCCSVRDNGIGIALQDQEKLFTRFYRVDSSMTREVSGTGLGLSIVKSIVEMHDGQISVQSEPGRGSTFAFSLPAAAIEAKPCPVASPSVMTRVGQSILVVESERLIAERVREMLERAGYQVHVAGSGEQAWEHLEQHTPDLIALNLQLPGMDGLALTDRLNASPALSHIPILVISVLRDGRGEATIGMIRPFSKSIGQDQLVSSVEQIIGQERSRRVLIVDDDESVATALSASLRKRGLTPLVAVQGQAALDLAKLQVPGLILLDLRMAGTDGYSILRALKQNPATAGTPVILMTRSENLRPGTRTRAIALGALDLIANPFDVDRLIGEVQKLLREDGCAD